MSVNTPPSTLPKIFPMSRRLVINRLNRAAHTDTIENTASPWTAKINPNAAICALAD